MLEKTRSRSNREQKKFPDFLWKIRDCPCLICGRQAEACHVRYSSAEYYKSNSRNDKFTVPLCPGHHRLYPDAQHSGSEFGFWQRNGIDPLRIATELWDNRNDLAKMQSICHGVTRKR